MNSKPWLTAVLFCLALSCPGCGQKGPLYIDDGADDSSPGKANPEDVERQKELKELEQRNESPPVITY